MMRVVFAVLSLILLSQAPVQPPRSLPERGVLGLIKSLDAARAHRSHIWRDTPALNPDGTITGYVEIARGDRRKWEFDMARHERTIDRVIPEEPGGYPVNYGFVPQTVSYDGDPFDVLVLGDPIDGGTLVRGVALGLFHMEDDKGLDSKVVIARTDAGGKPMHQLTREGRERIAAYFERYKQHEPGTYSKVSGWGTAEDGLAYVETTHEFFKACRSAQSVCHLDAKTGRGPSRSHPPG